MISVFCCVGGGKKVTRVEVTLDGGETWLLCELNHPEKPNKYGKYWCWCFWSIDVEVIDLLGAKEIAVRAWDQSLNTQPEKLVWNLMVRGVDRLAHHSVFSSSFFLPAGF
jgi:nitrate reductase (NAD(P)H)